VWAISKKGSFHRAREVAKLICLYENFACVCVPNETELKDAREIEFKKRNWIGLVWMAKERDLMKPLISSFISNYGFLKNLCWIIFE
jgi:hypothetical protein